MHFSLTNRLTCFVLFLSSTIVSSMSQEICHNLHDQHEKIRVLGEVYGGTTLLIITTSGHMFELDLNSTIRRHSSEGYYYLNISQEPSRHVKNEWPNVHLDLSENTNVLYGLFFKENSNKAILGAKFKTENKNWDKCLNECLISLCLEFGQTATKDSAESFEYCKNRANTLVSQYVDEHDSAFLVSGSCSDDECRTSQIVFWKHKKNSKDFCHGSSFCFTHTKMSGTALAASYLAKPYNILVFIYSSGLVEIRQVTTFPSNQAKAPEPNWTIMISEFIKCGSPNSELSNSTPKDTESMSTVLSTNLQIYYWILMFSVILFVIVILVIYLIKMDAATIFSKVKKRKKRKKKKNHKKHSPSTVNTKSSKGDTPNGSSATVSFSSPRESSTGLKFSTAQGSTLKGPSTASATATTNRSSQAKSSDLQFLTAQGNSATGSSTELEFATAQGSCLKGSTTGSGLSLAQGSSSMGSSILKKPSFGDSTLSSAFGSTPSSSPTNVNSKTPTKSQDRSPTGSSIASTLSITKKSGSLKGSSITSVKASSEVHSSKKSSLSTNVGTTRTSPTNAKSKAKRTLATKKQSIGKWIAGLLWAKEKNKKRNKDKRKDQKKDSYKK